MLGKDAVQRRAGFRVNSLVQVNAAYFGAGVWLINVLRPPPPRSSSRGTEGSNPSSSGSQSVSLVPSAATGTKGPGFAANVSLYETRERDMLASNRLAFAFFL